MNKQQLFTELSIKIATLDMKLNKVLELLNKPQEEYIIDQLVTHSHFDARDPEITRVVNKAIAEIPRWPNESDEAYRKRNGTYVEAYSQDEQFQRDFK